MIAQQTENNYMDTENNPGQNGINIQGTVDNAMATISLNNSVNLQGQLAAQQTQPLPVRNTKQTVPFVEEKKEQPQLMRTPAEVKGRQEYEARKETPPLPVDIEEDVETLENGAIVPKKQEPTYTAGQTIADRKGTHEDPTVWADLNYYLGNRDKYKGNKKELYNKFSPAALASIRNSLNDAGMTLGRAIPFNNVEKHLIGALNYANLMGLSPDNALYELNKILPAATNNSQNNANEQITYFELTGNTLGPSAEAYKSFIESQNDAVKNGLIDEEAALIKIDGKRAELTKMQPWYKEAVDFKGASQKDMLSSVLGMAIGGAVGWGLGKAAKFATNKAANYVLKNNNKLASLLKRWLGTNFTDEAVAEFGKDLYNLKVQSGEIDPVTGEVFTFDGVVRPAQKVAKDFEKKFGKDWLKIWEKEAKANPTSDIAKWYRIYKTKNVKFTPEAMAAIENYGPKEMARFDEITERIAAIEGYGPNKPLDAAFDDLVTGKYMKQDKELAGLYDKGMKYLSARAKADPEGLYADIVEEIMIEAKEAGKNMPKEYAEQLGQRLLEAKTDQGGWTGELVRVTNNARKRTEKAAEKIKNIGEIAEDLGPSIGGTLGYLEGLDPNAENGRPSDEDNLYNLTNYSTETGQYGPVSGNINAPYLDAVVNKPKEIPKTDYSRFMPKDDSMLEPPEDDEELQDLHDEINAKLDALRWSHDGELTDKDMRDYQNAVNEYNTRVAQKMAEQADLENEKLNEPIFGNNKELMDEYDRLTNDLDRLRYTATPEEANDLRRRIAEFNEKVRAGDTSEIDKIAKNNDKLKNLLDTVGKEVNPSMPKTWWGAYAAGEFGPVGSANAKRTLTYFALNSLGNALLNSAAIIQKRAPEQSQWNQYQGKRLGLAYENYYKTQQNKFDAHLNTITNALKLDQDHANKVRDLFSEGDLKILYNKLDDNRKASLVETAARWAPLYDKLNDKEKVIATEILMNTGLLPRDELGILISTYGKDQVASVLGKIQQTNLRDALAKAKFTEKQLTDLDKAIEIKIQQARLTKIEADLYKTKIYAELASHGVQAALDLLNKLLPGD